MQRLACVAVVTASLQPEHFHNEYGVTPRAAHATCVVSVPGTGPSDSTGPDDVNVQGSTTASGHQNAELPDTPKNERQTVFSDLHSKGYVHPVSCSSCCDLLLNE